MLIELMPRCIDEHLVRAHTKRPAAGEEPRESCQTPQQLGKQPEAAFAGVAPGWDPQQAVSRVWLFTLSALSTAGPQAVRVLSFLAWLAPDVPRDLVVTLIGNQTAADRALGLLSSYSMITLSRDSVSVHRLVLAVVRANPDHAAEAADAGRDNGYRCAVAVLARAIPNSAEPEHWPRWRALHPHILLVAEHWAAPDLVLARLLNQTALFEYSQGRHWLAQYHGALALTIIEHSANPDRVAIAAVLKNLAVGWRELGKLAFAVRSCKQALTIIQAAHGADHPDMAPILNNLASTYHTQGWSDKAAPLYRQALAIHVRTQDRRNAALVRGNLASCYLELGRAGDAVLLLNQAMAVTMDEYGPNHPETAMCLNNLASCYALVGRLTDARRLGQTALTKLDALFGDGHPQWRRCWATSPAPTPRLDNTGRRCNWPSGPSTSPNDSYTPNTRQPTTCDPCWPRCWTRALPDATQQCR